MIANTFHAYTFAADAGAGSGSVDHAAGNAGGGAAELSAAAVETEIQKAMTAFNTAVDDEVLARLFSFVDPRSLVFTITLVCKRWRDICAQLVKVNLFLPPLCIVSSFFKNSCPPVHTRLLRATHHVFIYPPPPHPSSTRDTSCIHLQWFVS